MNNGWKFRLIYGMVSLVAHLPLNILYRFSDMLYILLYYILRYRRRVAMTNIAESFPEKKTAEHKEICRHFFRNFSDYIFETIKLAHISDEEMMHRMEFKNTELMKGYMESGRSVVAYFSHCFNWEWAPSITLHCFTDDEREMEFCQVYRPLRNATFDAVMLELRSRFGSMSLKKRSVLRDLLRFRRYGIISVTGFMSDQKPSHGDPIHVVDFLNHPTAVITGTETLAGRLGMAAIYWDISRVSRGHYSITMRRLSDDVGKEEPMEVTHRYFRMLQQTIRENPSNWLWSHKRWKNKVTFDMNGKNLKVE
ncbi:MAG: lysophospholipid acyltransferase family protein [Muribaculaceae bacterium]|nr:lysophospholipid acyltransferase family protein [Muribaculaceae bacterium]